MALLRGYPARKLSELLRAIERVALYAGDSMQFETKRNESDGYSAELPIVTVDFTPGEPWHTRPRALLNFGEHAREHFTSDVALDLLESLSAGPLRAAKSLGLAEEGEETEVASGLAAFVFAIVPVSNPNGRRAMESGRPCERRNGRVRLIPALFSRLRALAR